MKRTLYAAASLGMASAIAITMISCGSTETPGTGQGKTTTAASSVASTWSVDGYLPRVVAGHGVAVLNGEILIFGGYDGTGGAIQQKAHTLFYTPGGGYDDSAADMPDGRANMGFCTHGGKAWAIAGYREGAGQWGRTTTVWSYDPTSNSWGTECSLTYTRANGAAAGLGDFVYTIGGHHEDTGHGFTLSRVERLDPDVGCPWGQVDFLNLDNRVGLGGHALGRSGLGAAVVDDKIYAVGGQSGEAGAHPGMPGKWFEVYDPATGTWATLPEMSTPRNAAAVAAVGDRIYAIGGEIAGGVYTDTVEYYDISEGAWHDNTPFPFAVSSARAVTVSGKLYVVGGRDLTQLFNTVYVMDGGGTPEAPDPILYWSFDDPGDVGHDDSGNGHDLTIPGSWTSVPGPQGQAISFDFYMPTGPPNVTGSPYGPYTSTSGLDYPGPDGFTVAYWAKVDAGTSPVVGDYWQHTAHGVKFWFRVSPDPDRIYFEIYHAFSPPTIIEVPASPYLGQWIHVASVYNPAGYAITLYINGEVVAQGNMPAPMRPATPPYLYTCGSWHATDPGTVDEVRIYDQALSSSEIAELASGGGPSCGDGVCESPEDNATCPQDCYCGNGTCDSDENDSSCPGDCRPSDDGFHDLPPRSPDATNLVVVVHGWKNSPSDFADMGTYLEGRLQGVSSWDVRLYDWEEHAAYNNPPLLWPSRANIRAAETHGQHLAEQIVGQSGYEHVHFIAHSLGGRVIDTAANIIRGCGELVGPCSPFSIHTTFLDAYTPRNWERFFGSSSTWSEHYYYDDAVVVNTQDDFAHAHNVDITNLKSLYGDAEDGHGYPKRWYENTIRFETRPPQDAGYGFPLSKEASPLGWDPSELPPADGRTVTLPLTGGAGWHHGISVSNTQSISPAAGLADTSDTGLIDAGPDYLNMETGSPVWAVLQIDLNKPVNYFEFASEFSSAADGLLSVYLDGELIYQVFERFSIPGIPMVPRITLGEPLTPGTHSIMFRLDALTNEASVVTIANIEFSLLTEIVTKLVVIDIKPGSDPNSINLGSHGVIPVAILTTADFDATTVDPNTVALAGSGVAIRGNGRRLLASQEDVDDDGDLDLMLHVETENLTLETGSMDAVLTAQTYDGEPVSGSDTVNIVGD